MQEQLPSVTYPATDIPCNIFITITVARSRNQFYFVQRVSQRSDEFLNCCSLKHHPCNLCRLLASPNKTTPFYTRDRRSQVATEKHRPLSLTRFKQLVSHHTISFDTKLLKTLHEKLPSVTYASSSLVWQSRSPLMQFPKVDKDRLIADPSFSLSPVAPVESARSLEAEVTTL